MGTFFHPQPRYVPHLDQENPTTVRELCEWAGILCRATGPWIQRSVSWSFGEDMAIIAEPGYVGAVHVVLPEKPTMARASVARELLMTLAYGLFDGVARESIRGMDWSRNIVPRGRPKLSRAKTSAERQRSWRQRHQANRSRHHFSS